MNLKALHKSFLLVVLISIMSVPFSISQEKIFYPDFPPKPLFATGTENPVINLNGSWDICPDPDERFWRSPKARKLQWSEIEVPGEWLMQGFEVEENTRAAYHREIEIPKSWDGHVILMKCDAVYSLSEVYVNGKLAGSHEGGFTAFQLDVTGYMRPGKKNSIIIGVQSESLADTLASATQYAAHQLGGITRKIELFALPEVYFNSLNYNTFLDDNGHDAEVVLDITIANSGKRDVDGLAVKVNLSQIGGPALLMPAEGYPVPPVKAGGTEQMQVRIPVSRAKLWDPEHPNLYRSVVSLVNGKDVLQKTSSKIGIREVKVVGNQIFVNRRPIKLRGINRHEVHPLRGRSLTMDEWLADAMLFKEANLNYIRTSHYPPGEEFISICDSVGLFVECEAPLCWIGHGANSHWQKADPHSPDLYPLIRQMNLENVAQYRNHPSIILWSLANESAWGPNWEKVLREVQDADPSRPVSFHDQTYGGFNNHGSVNCPVANMHYPGPAGPSIARKYDRPLLFGEYAHLNTYNRQEIITDPGVRDAWGRGLESMWEDMYHSTGCLGGAIWSGIDDVFYLPSGKAVGYGEWGPIDGWRRPKPEYWHLKKIYSPVKIVQRIIKYPDEGNPIQIALENRNLYTNMSEIRIDWKLGNMSGEASMNLAPRNSGILSIYPDLMPGRSDKLELVFISPQGFMIDKYSLGFSTRIEENDVELVPVPALTINERSVSVTMGEEVWLINAVNGKIENIRIKNKTIITGGPELMILPLRTGPCNTEHSLFIEPLNDVCKNWKGKVTGAGEDNGVVYVEVTGSYDEAEIVLKYWFGRSADVEIEYSLVVKKDIDPRQIGLVFSMPSDFENFSWERIGQWSAYPDDHIGRTSGSVKPFPKGSLVTDKPGSEPKDTWEQDYHELGINDFRATRDKLLWGKLSDAQGFGASVISDGNGAMRPFVGKDDIKFLAAGFSTAGGDLFFSTHLKNERNPMKAGDNFKSKLVLRID